MEFVLQKHSPLPVEVQLQEQIKLALLLGRLRPGDTLPSIRDVEKQVGVSRNIVRKAYLALQRSGILILRHGKGVLVEKELSYSERESVMHQCEKLSRDTLAKARALGISPSAFARYLYQEALKQETAGPFLLFVDASKLLAQERAAKISAFWQVNVPGVSIDDLGSMKPEKLKHVRKILTIYIRFDQVRKIVKRHGIEVIPLSLEFSPAMLEEFRGLPADASVVLILDDRDYPSLSLILQAYKNVLVEPSVKLSAIPLSRVRDLQRFVSSNNHDKIIFSNRIWESVPERIKKHPKVTRPRMEIALASLESARIRAGVVI